MNARKIVLFSMLALSAVTAARADEDNAFWMRDEYKPEGKDVGGVPIAEINPNWTAASALTTSMLSTEAKAYLNDPGTKDWTGSASFERKGDFNGDGVPDRAIVGVYADKSGAMGRFLVILTQKKGGWATAFVHEDPSAGPGFSYLTTDGEQFLYGTCFECDGMAVLSWQKHTYQLQIPDEDSEAE